MLEEKMWTLEREQIEDELGRIIKYKVYDGKRRLVFVLDADWDKDRDMEKLVAEHNRCIHYAESAIKTIRK